MMRTRAAWRRLAPMEPDPRNVEGLIGLVQAIDLANRKTLWSRPTFVERVQESPMHYVGRLHVHLAAGALRETFKSVHDVAHEVGYADQCGFLKAFKRVYGVTATPSRAPIS